MATGSVQRALSDARSALPGPRVLRWGFNRPDALTVAGDDLFVANNFGNSVTELDISTGALVRVVSGPAYRFNDPDALAVTSGDLFVANYAGNSVTEIRM